jgi:hypothetical protein
MVKDGIYNANDHSNNAMNPPPLELVVGHANLALETMVRMQQAKLLVPPTEGRPLSRKTKNDASKTMAKQTKKQRDTIRALQVGYRKHM